MILRAIHDLNFTQRTAAHELVIVKHWVKKSRSVFQRVFFFFLTVSESLKIIHSSLNKGINML